MQWRLPWVILMLLLMAPAAGIAQESEGDLEQPRPQTMVIEQWICSFEQLGAIEEAMAQRHEIYQELVDAGVLIAWGVYYHDWGDEWNVSAYTVASDKAAFFAAWENEVSPRLEERFPDRLNLYDHDVCTAHRDNIYRMGVVTQPASQP